MIKIVNLASVIILSCFASSALALEPQEIAQLAKQTTVKIIVDGEGQTGVLIGQDEESYWALTCTPQAKSALNKAQIVTSDNRSYNPVSAKIIHLEQFPVSLIAFNADSAYNSANLGDSNTIQQGERVYIAGFIPQRNQEQAFPPFLFTDGLISSVVTGANKTVFTYTNQVYTGMEGMPIFNQQGAIIGLQCQDYPSANRQKKELQINWGIPISPLREFAEQKGINFGFRALGSPPPSPNY